MSKFAVEKQRSLKQSSLKQRSLKRSSLKGPTLEQVFTGSMVGDKFPIQKYEDIVKKLMEKIGHNNNIEVKFIRRSNRNLNAINNLYAFYKQYMDHVRDIQLDAVKSKWGNTVVPAKLKYKYGNIIDKLPKNINVYADYGCGSGAVFTQFKDVLNPKSSYCIDYKYYGPQDLLDSKKTQDPERGLFVPNNLSTSFGSYFNGAGLDDEHGVPINIDVMTMLQSLHHVMFDDAPQKKTETLEFVVKEISKVMKPGAYLVLREHDIRNIDGLCRVLIEHMVYEIMEIHQDANETRLSFSEFKQYVTTYHTTHIGTYMSREYIGSLLKKYGFVSISLFYPDLNQLSFTYSELYQRVSD